jgi:hypothetical protein
MASISFAYLTYLSILIFLFIQFIITTDAIISLFTFILLYIFFFFAMSFYNYGFLSFFFILIYLSGILTLFLFLLYVLSTSSRVGEDEIRL